jgi:hypothetical protein
MALTDPNSAFITKAAVIAGFRPFFSGEPATTGLKPARCGQA